jgi:integrase
MKQKEAEWLRKKQNEMVTHGMTVEELCNRHLRYQVEQDELKPKSIDRRECTIDCHIGAYPLGKMQIGSVTAKEIDNHINGLIREGKLSSSSIEKALDVLNAAYNWAVAREELSSNPVTPVKASMQKRIQKLNQKSASDADVVVMSPDEEKRFIQEAVSRTSNGEKYKYSAGLALVFLDQTALRCGELIALRWRDIQWDPGLLTVEKSSSVVKNRDNHNEKKYVQVTGSTKNEKARIIKLSKEAMQTLRAIHQASAHVEPDDLIITTQTGRAQTATNLEHRAAVIFKNAGLTAYTGGLHIFRRTFATRMYENGARVADIAAYIGDLESTTMQYYIAKRKKYIASDGTEKQIVELPA